VSDGAARTRFTLLVVATADGLMARAPGHTPAEWASGEEQTLFLDAVDAADWGVLGRTTHEVVYRPNRRRIIFSSSVSAPEWREHMHLWLDPGKLTPGDLAALVADRRPMREALILGGAAVHDWFHRHGRIDSVSLTIEPIRFGAGLPIFGDQTARDAAEAFLEKGYVLRGERRLNRIGTRLVVFDPPPTRPDR
jgi:dihydrofolate reductase